MSYGFKIMVKGDYAAFNRPEMKVERVSMTFRHREHLRD